MYKTLEIKNGDLKMKVTSLGATIMNLFTPDAKGKKGDVVLGFNEPEEYLKCDAYLGAVIGRVANRTANAKFKLDGKTFNVTKNETALANQLHGGKIGFDKVNWDIAACSGKDWKGVSFHYLSKDGEEGYQGNLSVNVTYKLTDYNQLVIEYLASTDAPTLCNLTQHTYFDLSAGKAKNILGNILEIDADFYNPIDSKLRTTGEVLKVKGTPLDFTKPRQIGEVMQSDEKFFALTRGIDHNFVLRNNTGELKRAGTLSDPISGRVMTVHSTEPCMQVYTGNFLNNIAGKKRTYNENAGVALETQHTPNAANHPHLPSIALYPNEMYNSMTVYSF